VADKLRFGSVAAVLRVADVTRSMRWYEDILGLKAYPFPALSLSKGSEQEPYVFCILEGEKIRIMLSRHPGYQRDPAFRGSDLYITVRDNTLREVYEDLRHRATVVRELEHMPYGDCEFEIVDPDGYVICISELLDNPSGIPDAREG
jgi:uncharacterized glyoxalase superfamily protein PhnB